MIDETDRQILAALQQNARMSNARIARQIGMAPSAILERIRKLENKGIIQGYEVRLKPGTIKLGLLAYIFVRTNDAFGSLKCAEQLAALPEVQEVHHIAGEDCYLIKVRTQDTEALGRLLRGKLSEIKEVTSTRTTIVLETIKESNCLPLNLTEE